MRVERIFIVCALVFIVLPVHGMDQAHVLRPNEPCGTHNNGMCVPFMDILRFQRLGFECTGDERCNTGRAVTSPLDTRVCCSGVGIGSARPIHRHIFHE